MGVVVGSDQDCQTLLHRYCQCRNWTADVAVVAAASDQRKRYVDRVQVAMRFQLSLLLLLLRLWPRKSFEAMVQIRVGCARKNSFKKKG